MSETNGFQLRRPKAQTPTKRDFMEGVDGLDMYAAWDYLGGLNADEAYEAFAINPDAYKEKFLAMGPRAFHYYFPVIDRHLREAHAEDEQDDCQARIFGTAIEMQFEQELTSRQPLMSPVCISEIKDLAEYVLANLSQYMPHEKGRDKLRKIWERVIVKIEETINSRERQEQKYDYSQFEQFGLEPAAGPPPEREAYNGDGISDDTSDWAWLELGRRSLREVYGFFCASPRSFEKSFSIFGTEGFDYYVSAAGRCLRGLSAYQFEKYADEIQIATIGETIANRLERFAQSTPSASIELAAASAAYLMANIEVCSNLESEREEIRSVWQRVIVAAAKARQNA